MFVRVENPVILLDDCLEGTQIQIFDQVNECKGVKSCDFIG